MTTKQNKNKILDEKKTTRNHIKNKKELIAKKTSDDLSDSNNDNASEITENANGDDNITNNNDSNNNSNNSNDNNDDDNTDNNNTDSDKKKNKKAVKNEETIKLLTKKVLKYLDVEKKIKQTDKISEMKELKKEKKDIENMFIKYLDEVNEEFIQIGNRMLLKVEKESKGGINGENISTNLNQLLKKHKIFDDEKKMRDFIKELLVSVENSREIKIRKCIKNTKVI